MAGLLAIFAEFEREILRECRRAGLAQARRMANGLARPETAARYAAEIRKRNRAGISKREIAPAPANRPHLGAPHLRSNRA